MIGRSNLINFQFSGFNDILHDEKLYRHEVNELRRHRLYVGALKTIGNKSIEFMQMICAVQNFGCSIKPVNGKYLTIPTPNANGHRAGYFGRYSRGNPTGLFFHIASSSGKPTLARYLDGRLQVVFLLSKQVNIPARGFIDKTAYDCLDNVNSVVQSDLAGYWDGSTGYMTTLNHIGKILADKMVKNIMAWSDPANSLITQANKGNNNPLVATGDLERSITWVIEHE